MRGVVVMVTGVIVILSSAAHSALGWPEIRRGLTELRVDEDLAGAIAAGWYFGSAAMAAFGLMLIAFGMRLRRGDASALLPVRIIAACYLVFGLAALIIRKNPHFLLFVATGLMAGLPTWRGGRGHGADRGERS